MLTPFDDYPVHQVAQPLSQAGAGHTDFYDRFWFNGYDEDRYFALALGSYPNRGVIDAAFSVVSDGQQRSVFTSAPAPADRSTTRVGPIAIDIIEPMRRARITVDAPEQELRADITFSARTPAFEEPRQTNYRGPRLFMDVTRATQLGDWSGTITSGSTTWEVSGVWGTKDRSWGVRPIGSPAPIAPPIGAAAEPQFCFLWAPLNFDDVALHYLCFEDANGVAWAEGAAEIPVLTDGAETCPVDPAERRIHDAALDIEWEPGLRRSRHASLRFADDRERVELEPLLTFRMSGVGYGHPRFRHGEWLGEIVAGEVWDVDAIDDTAPDHLHVQQVMRATWGDRVGLGVLEQYVVGPQRRRGLTGFNDGFSPTD